MSQRAQAAHRVAGTKFGLTGRAVTRLAFVLFAVAALAGLAIHL